MTDSQSKEIKSTTEVSLLETQEKLVKAIAISKDMLIRYPLHAESSNNPHDFIKKVFFVLNDKELYPVLYTNSFESTEQQATAVIDLLKTQFKLVSAVLSAKQALTFHLYLDKFNMSLEDVMNKVTWLFDIAEINELVNIFMDEKEPIKNDCEPDIKEDEVHKEKKWMDENEVVELMKSSKTEQEWNTNALKVVKICDGYPWFWNKIIADSGIAKEMHYKFYLDSDIPF